MVLDKKEIIKMVLFDINEYDYEILKESLEGTEEKESFPNYDEIRDNKYKVDKGLIYLDEAPGDQTNWKGLHNQIKDANYDLRLGKQYILGEKIYELDPNKNPILKIPPHDVVVVLTFEILKIPKKLMGNFSLNLGFVLKGLMLANGSQVSPGYKGKLACVLFNLTNKPILLKYKDPFAKISFFELTNSGTYIGDHQEFTKIQQFIGESMPTSGLENINAKIEDYHKDLEKYKKDIEDKIRNTIIIILAIISAILTIYNIFIGNRST